VAGGGRLDRGRRQDDRLAFIIDAERSRAAAWNRHGEFRRALHAEKHHQACYDDEIDRLGRHADPEGQHCIPADEP
jgi:hypothetical protein